MYPPTSHTNTLANIASHITSSFSGSPSKRRLPGGPSFGAASSTRDTKSRRRDDTRRMGNSAANWDGAKDSGKREKEDLIDSHIVDFFRKGKF